ncbi:ABC transporter ATP-binding protein [Saccharothrix obliqua]|uniref:ABC transporter ATP-binding protein n=1 Tax=Saccharothrix obliqua TaxID=2861747 RepID=UPI001C5E5D7C|nr:ABC transporter ATP-binding protein [Saccharothrix obliqua]MBW4721523.1 ABC transporter ATP-binding protein [Saccharothrix obliqua]
MPGDVGHSATGELLAVRGLTKAYGDFLVLDDVGFSLPAGAAAGVVGPNGSGKSTLLRCVVGTESADSGTVLLDGVVLDETASEVRAALAGVLDDVDFFTDLSVVDHLRLYAWAHGATDPDDVVDGVLAELGLAAAADQLPSTLSSGQRRRLALAACFVRPRRLLVLDEPEQRLDAAGRVWLAERLRGEKAAGTAVLIASHDDDLLDAVVDMRVHVGA